MTEIDKVELELVPEEDWDQCLIDFEKNFPKSLPYIYSLQNYTKYLKEKKGKNLRVYKITIGKTKWIYVFTPHKDIYDLYQVFTNCDEVEDKHLKCLLDGKVIDWSQGQFFYAMENKLWHCLKKELKLSKNTEPCYFGECYFYWISKENAEKFDIECPEGFIVKHIDEQYTELINSIWPHRFEGSDNYVRELLKTFGGFGVFCKSSNNLVSWILINENYALTMLQTIEGYEGRGFAKILVKQSSKSLAEKNFHTHAFVVATNEKPKKIFEKLGFEKISTVYFIRM